MRYIMTFDHQAKLGRNLSEIRDVLGLDRSLPPGTKPGDLGYLYLSSDHYLDAIREFRQALDSNWSDTASIGARRDVREKLAWCYYWTGSYGEAEKVLRRGGDPATDRPGALLLEGRIALERGELDEAERFATLTLEAIAARDDSSEWVGPARSLLGIAAQQKGAGEEARTHFEEALLAYRVAADADGECRSYIHLGTLSKTECRWEEALRFLEKGRALADEEGFYYLYGSASLNLGNLHFRLGDHEKALEAILEGNRVFKEIGYQLGIVRSLIAQARIHLLRAEFSSVREALDLGATLCRAGRFKRERVHLEIFEGEAALLLDDDRAAERHYRIALHLAEEITATGGMAATASLHLAQFLIGRSAVAEGRKILAAVAGAADDPSEEGWYHTLLAEAELADGNLEDAEEAISAAITRFEKIGYRQELARALTVAGKISAASGGSLSQTDRVLTHYLRARRIWEELSADRSVAEVCVDIARYWFARHDLDESLTYLQSAARLYAGVNDTRGLSVVAALRRTVEDRLVEEIHPKGESVRTTTPSAPPRPLEENIDTLLREALRHAEGDIAFLAVGTTAEKLAIRGAHGVEEEKAASLLSSILVEDPGFFDEMKPFFPGRGERERPDGAAIVLPFVIDEKERAILYVERSGSGPYDWFRLREVQHLAGITYEIGDLIVEERNSALRRENSYLKEKLENRFPLANIVTGDPKMIETLDIASRIASYPITVLIEGETGTGKQLLAQAIHDTGDRANRPFITVNCASLPEQILESELFGYEKGSFTGAIQARKGLFEEADGGTVFLDEIGKAGPHVQRALLHVLDQGEIRPVGSNVHRTVDVRVVCATSNLRLKEDISDGAFLKDLYYRINDITLRLPPLRERQSDIRLLAEYFIETFSVKVKRDGIEGDAAFLAALDQYDWPGNVRELEKAVQRAILLATGDHLTVADLPDEVRGTIAAVSPPAAAEDLPLKEEVERLEVARIRESLERNHGNRSRTARDLGLSLRGLRNKIQRYGLDSR